MNYVIDLSLIPLGVRILNYELKPLPWHSSATHCAADAV